MVALVLAEDRARGARDIVVAVDHGVGPGVGPALRVQDAQVIEGFGRGRQFVDLVAAGLASAAADATGGVEQHAEAPGIPLEMFVSSGVGRLAESRTHSGGSKQAKKRSS